MGKIKHRGHREHREEKRREGKALPLHYKDTKLDCGYRLDLLVEGKVVVEIKSITEILKLHEAQLITYLKLSGCQVGLLMNFNSRVLKDGIRRIII